MRKVPSKNVVATGTDTHPLDGRSIPARCTTTATAAATAAATATATSGGI